MASLALRSGCPAVLCSGLSVASFAESLSATSSLADAIMDIHVGVVDSHDLQNEIAVLFTSTTTAIVCLVCQVAGKKLDSRKNLDNLRCLRKHRR